MVARRSVSFVQPDALFLKVLPRVTRRAFLRCIRTPLFEKSSWYLAGGTALSLQEGHRQSVDLDFFTPHNQFREINLERTMLKTSEWQTSFRQAGTLYGEFCGAKMSFIAYPFFSPSQKMLKCGTVSILQSGDIAAMKIIAISQRGRKRDFIDLYWYCKKTESLETVLKKGIPQFTGQEHNINHIVRSLSYFDDAEQDPMPKIFFKATWKEVKKFFQQEAKKIAQKWFVD